MDVVRKTAFFATRDTLSPLLARAAETVLRLFGATPHTLFSRMDTLAGTTTRGIAYTYEKLGPNRCELQADWVQCEGLPIALFESTAGGLLAVYSSCGVTTGKVSAPTPVPGAVGRAVRFELEW
jgi:hypothetical protein